MPTYLSLGKSPAEAKRALHICSLSDRALGELESAVGILPALGFPNLFRLRRRKSRATFKPRKAEGLASELARTLALVQSGRLVISGPSRREIDRAISVVKRAHDGGMFVVAYWENSIFLPLSLDSVNSFLRATIGVNATLLSAVILLILTFAVLDWVVPGEASIALHLTAVVLVIIGLFVSAYGLTRAPEVSKGPEERFRAWFHRYQLMVFIGWGAAVSVILLGVNAVLWALMR